MDLGNIGTAFALIFLAEFGDKTQFAVVGVSALARLRWAVFLGSAAAFIVLALAASIIGSIAGDLIPAEWVGIAAGTLFLVIGALTLRAALGHDADDGEAGAGGAKSQSFARVAASTFAMIFVAEMGDKSQLAVTGLAAESGDLLGSFIGSALALVTLTGLGIVGGAALSRYLKPKMIKTIAAVVFLGVGLVLLVGAIAAMR
ncbi:MAG: TMEM165/GDT1 family protein [SAR202 cluster bacterium]|nr:TMEM165/GDT1 family protein [SAR202 cluster bacterium]